MRIVLRCIDQVKQEQAVAVQDRWKDPELLQQAHVLHACQADSTNCTRANYQERVGVSFTAAATTNHSAGINRDMLQIGAFVSPAARMVARAVSAPTAIQLRLESEAAKGRAMMLFTA